MNFTDIIIKKRNGNELTTDEIKYFIDGAVNKTIPDYQLSALLMAIAINSMNERETADLTKAMTYSGNVMDLSDVKGIKTDKHSTGGVGDTTTLVLAPLIASLGLPVVKMSGRGLGHTGGTLDKLESIPGFNVNIPMDKAIEQVNKTGIVIMGQTQALDPADKYLYALRDVTGTVESLPLIASSIMSKKLAAGADAIVLDVKTGNGAFMKNEKDALELAKAMISSGKSMGRSITALITDMSEPLGLHIGNSLEVIEAIEILKGKREGRLKEVSLALGAEMLVLGGIAEYPEQGRMLMEENIHNGKGIEKFIELIETQGGDSRITEDYSLFAQPDKKLELKADRSGYIYSVNCYDIGRASLCTGAGRLSKESKIDFSAGIIMHCRIGDTVERGDIIAEIFAADNEKCIEAADIIKNAVNISDSKPKERKLIYEILR